MPQFKLFDYECEENLLPAVCMVCGTRATVTFDRKFSWYPSWIWITVLVGVLVPVILMIVLQKKMRVQIPLCDIHESRWKGCHPRQFIVSIVFALLFCLFAGIITLTDNWKDPDIVGICFVGGSILLILWICFLHFATQAPIGVKQITDRDITLTKVNAQFIDALREDRRAEEALYRERKGRRKLELGERDTEREDYRDED